MLIHLSGSVYLVIFVAFLRVKVVWAVGGGYIYCFFNSLARLELLSKYLVLSTLTDWCMVERLGE